MPLANNMSSFPINDLPPLWYVSKREHLETYYAALQKLHQKISKYVGGQNIVTIFQAAKSLDQLAQQIEHMDTTLASHLSPFRNEYNPHKGNELKRIKELALLTSVQLDTVAKQISWGMSTNQEVSQIIRNLYPLLQLLEDILAWLDEVS